MTRSRQRANGEGSIFPYRNGYAAYVWVTTPDGRRRRKWIYGKTRQDVHGKWLKLHEGARRGPVPTSSPTLAECTAYWLREVIVPPDYAPLTCAALGEPRKVHLRVLACIGRHQPRTTRPCPQAYPDTYAWRATDSRATRPVRRRGRQRLSKQQGCSNHRIGDRFTERIGNRCPKGRCGCVAVQLWRKSPCQVYPQHLIPR
jgi:hypothetical protein